MRVKQIIKKYKWFLVLLFVNLALLFVQPTVGVASFEIIGDSLLELLSVVPPIFILIGLLDVWVEKETMINFMGEGSGIKGIAIAFFLGSAAAGPLYVAFPLAKVFIKKGAALFNVLIFIGAWSTTKIPLMLFEASALGSKFALTRLLVNIPVIIIIAFITKRSLGEDDLEEIKTLAQID